jgi:hypothetical protein
MPQDIEVLLKENAKLRQALMLAEDVLSRSPFSTAIWPNGMHPQIGIAAIREALGEQTLV